MMSSMKSSPFTATAPVPPLTTRDMARILGLSIRQVQHLAATGKIPGAVKAGRDWIFTVTVDPTMR
jgi:hypothetical protein